MRNLEEIAVDVLKCAAAHAPESRLVGNVMACELALLAERLVDTCPSCGATAWVNIDCDLCIALGALVRSEEFTTPTVTEEELADVQESLKEVVEP